MTGTGGSARHPSRLLRGIGAHAVIHPDGYSDGAWVLSIGGAEQSHVDLARPQEIFYEYLRRIGNVLDLAAPPGRPLRALHLGAGALTLARYLQATRPGSEQHAVELERELLDFVLADVAPLGFEDATELARRLPELIGVAAIPVAPFCHDEGAERTRTLLRFAFCKKTDVLTEAADRLAKLGAAL